MDPAVNIVEQRQLAARVLSGDIDNLTTLAQTGEHLAELVVDLDEWRTAGGFDPYATDAVDPYAEIRAEACQVAPEDLPRAIADAKAGLDEDNPETVVRLAALYTRFELANTVA